MGPKYLRRNSGLPNKYCDDKNKKTFFKHL